MNVAAIVPAFNEEKTIGSVVETLKHVSSVSEIVVVNDGSTDQTSEVAKSYGIPVLDLAKNRGKGGALLAGVRLTSSPVLLFLDADLLDLTAAHVENLLHPVLEEGKTMSLGLIDRGEIIRMSANFFIKKNIRWPSLTGQRAILRSVFEEVPLVDLQSYGLEVAVNEYCRRKELPVAFVHLPGLGHVIKEKKMGFWRGLFARILMFAHVTKTFLKVRSR